jgi:hypothetical protein
MERSADRMMKLHAGKNTAEILFRIISRNCSKVAENLENLPGCEFVSFSTAIGLLTATNSVLFMINSHKQTQCFTKFSMMWRKMPPLNSATNYQEYFT